MISRSRKLLPQWFLLISLFVLLSGCHNKMRGYAVPLYQQPAGFSETYKQHLFANEQLVYGNNSQFPEGRCKTCKTDRDGQPQNLSGDLATSKEQTSLPPTAPSPAYRPTPQIPTHPSAVSTYSAENARNGRREPVPDQTSKNRLLSPVTTSRSRLILQKY